MDDFISKMSPGTSFSPEAETTHNSRFPPTLAPSAQSPRPTQAQSYYPPTPSITRIVPSYFSPKMAPTPTSYSYYSPNRFPPPPATSPISIPFGNRKTWLYKNYGYRPRKPLFLFRPLRTYEPLEFESGHRIVKKDWGTQRVRVRRESLSVRESAHAHEPEEEGLVIFEIEPELKYPSTPPRDPGTEGPLPSGYYHRASTGKMGPTPDTVAPDVVRVLERGGEDEYCRDAPHYVVYSWVLCMVSLAAFLKLYFLVKASIISLLALSYTLLIFIPFNSLFADPEEPAAGSDSNSRWQ